MEIKIQMTRCAQHFSDGTIACEVKNLLCVSGKNKRAMTEQIIHF